MSSDNREDQMRTLLDEKLSGPARHWIAGASAAIPVLFVSWFLREVSIPIQLIVLLSISYTVYGLLQKLYFISKRRQTDSTTYAEHSE